MFDLIRPLKFMMTSYTTDQSVLIEPTLNKLNTDGAMEQSAILMNRILVLNIKRYQNESFCIKNRNFEKFQVFIHIDNVKTGANNT